jgi:hypothetical protein
MLIDRTPKLIFFNAPAPTIIHRRGEDVEESGDEQHEEDND